MERDFLGLSLKKPLGVVKEEATDGYKEIGFNKDSGIRWPFSNKVSALPHLMSSKVAQEEKIKKIGSDPLVSSGFMSISSVDGFDPNKKHSFAEIQMFPASNPAISIPISSPFIKNHYTNAGLVGITQKPQLLGGIPISAPHSILPTIGSVAGITESCNKATGSPAQLTIFYSGTVSVYDDIDPEKAQAIMLLAGNGSCISSNIVQQKIQVQAPSSKPVAGDVPVGQPITTPPCSRLSSPLSVSSHTGAQSGSGSTSTEEIKEAKTAGVATTPLSKLEPPKIASAVVSVSSTAMVPSVPQARKASLARFLEKRKERVMNAAPYNHSMKSLEFASLCPME